MKPFNIKLSPDATMPTRALDSAGYDLYAPHGYTIYHRDKIIIDTGVAIHINRPDVCGLILPRSSTGSKGLVITNTVPLIDYGFVGNIILKVTNREEHPIRIMKGDRIAQIFFPYIYHPVFNIVDSHDETERGCGGFGSTNSTT